MSWIVSVFYSGEGLSMSLRARFILLAVVLCGALAGLGRFAAHALIYIMSLAFIFSNRRGI